MLSRVADNLYWMSRDLERAEHTARLLDVNLHQRLDQGTGQEQLRWQRLCKSLLLPVPEETDAYSITNMLTFDTSSGSSILANIEAARENARQVRELITSEMWEQINRHYLQVKSTTIEDIWYGEPHAFLVGVKESIQLFQGITDATMIHAEGWHFIGLGRFLERAMATALLIDTYFQRPEGQEEMDSDEQASYLDWAGLLRSCAAFDSFRKEYTAAKMNAFSVAEFLLFNAESPRTIRFATATMLANLQGISRITDSRRSNAERLAGRLRASLDYDQMDDIRESMHSYLDNIRRQCTQIHNAIYKTYITYPIDVALAH
jgi:uncharacterized alpha-E superfamily protein